MKEDIKNSQFNYKEDNLLLLPLFLLQLLHEDNHSERAQSSLEIKLLGIY